MRIQAVYMYRYLLLAAVVGGVDMWRKGMSTQMWVAFGRGTQDARLGGGEMSHREMWIEVEEGG